MIKKGIVCILCFFCLSSNFTAQSTQCYQIQSCLHLHTHNTATLWAIPTALIGSALVSVGFSWFRAPVKDSPRPEALQITTLTPRNHFTSEPKLLNLSAVKQHLCHQKNTAVCIDLGQNTVKIHTVATHTNSIIQDNSTITSGKHAQNATSSTTPTTKKSDTRIPMTAPQKQIYKPVLTSQNHALTPTWLVSPGFMGHRPQKYSQESEPESGLDQAAHFIEGSIIHGPCVTFNYNDERRVFNFGQTADLACLRSAYDQVKNKDNVLIGTCRGATTLLNLLSRLDQKDFAHIKAVILESPSLNLKNLATQVAHSYIGWLPKSPTILHSFFRVWFPNYDPNYPSFLPKLGNIPEDIPVLIGHLEGDKVISYNDITAIVHQLRTTGHKNVYLTIMQDKTITHARLSRIPAFQQVTNAFLRHYDIAYDEGLAAIGEPLLKKALLKAQTV